MGECASLFLLEPEQIDCASVGVVHGEDFFEQAESFGLFAEPEPRLRVKEASSDVLAPGKVFIEEKHGRQGGGEVVDLRGLPLKMGGVVENHPESVGGHPARGRDGAGPGHSSKCFRKQLAPASAESRPSGGRTAPVTFGFAVITGIVVRHAEPVVNHAEVHQQVFGFAEILGWGGCGKQSRDGRRGLSTLQRTMGKQYIGTNILRQHKALATLPRLEFATEEQVESTFWPIEVVVESSEFDGKIVALLNKRRVGFKIGQALGEGMASASQKLVVFVKDACVAGRGGAGVGEGLKGASHIVKHVEVRDAEIAPGCCEGRFGCNCAFPHRDGFGVASAVIQQVAEIVGRILVISICFDSFA